MKNVRAEDQHIRHRRSGARETPFYRRLDAKRMQKIEDGGSGDNSLAQKEGLQMKYKKIQAVLLSMMLVCTMAGCKKDGEVQEAEVQAASGTSEHAIVSTVTLTEGKYSEEKLQDTWDAESAVCLKLDKDEISVEDKPDERITNAEGDNSDGNGVRIAEDTVTITQEGTYIFSGELEDGQIIVDADKDAVVRLVFNGVSVANSSSAPLYSKGGNVIVTLVDGSENVFEDAGVYSYENEGDDEPDAAIFAKDDLTFNGTGTLKVTGEYHHAIHCKDDLKFVTGTYMITAADDGIVGKDSVSVKNGNFTIVSGDDGIKATNIEETDKGYVLIEDGAFQITAGGDGIQAETLLRVNDGDVDIETGGGSENAEKKSDMPGKMPAGKMTGRWGSGTDVAGGETVMPDGMKERSGGSPEGMKPPEGAGEGAEGPDGSTEGMEGPDGFREGMESPEGMGERMEGADGSPEGMEPPEGMGEGVEGADGPPKGMEEGMAPPDGTPEGIEAEGTTPEAQETGKGGAGVSAGREPEDSSSAKALKSYVDLIIAGGDFELDCCDDGLHSNQNVTIEDGTFLIRTGDDGVHADKKLTIHGGNIDISQSYEGLEGFEIEIHDGDIRIIASDDGINAASGSTDSETGDNNAASGSTDSEIDDSKVSSGKEDSEANGINMPSGREDSEADGIKDAGTGRRAGGPGGGMPGENQGAVMTLNGGTVYVNAGGDGLDANGDIFINGGEITVHGPENGGNGTLDYAGTCKITGGTFLGAGSMGMAQSPSEDSTQPVIVWNTDTAVEAGTVVSVADSNGEIIAEMTTEKKAQWFAVSSPKLAAGAVYTVCAGEVKKEIEVSRIIN